MLRLYKAFLNTCAGFGFGLRTERAIQQEFALLVIGIPLAIWLGTTMAERVMLIVAILAVLCVEFLNTAIEKLCDHVTPERHAQIKAIKDMGSSACFCAQLCALAVWGMVVAARL